MPVVTISRGTFSGGRSLAECIAADLGCPCVSREVITEAAEQYGVSAASLSDALSNAPSLMDRLRRDRDHYVAFVRAVLCQHARAGCMVYHGHAGHLLLAGIRHVLRVRVVADTPFRVAAAMEMLGINARQAEAHIRKVDETRRKWTRFLYGVEWDDPSNYDVVLNLEHMGLSGACAAVTRLAALPQFQPTDASREALDNLALQSLVIAALAKDERTRDADFRVQAKSGVVTVEGLTKLRDRAAVREVATAVEGVREVVDNVVTEGVPG